MTAGTQTIELTLSRTIAASPAEVFDAWLDPKHPGNPWTGAQKLILDAHVDGLFYFMHVSAADTKAAGAQHDAALGLQPGEQRAHYGRFLAIEPKRRLQYTWMSKFTRGLESIVTVTFERKGEDTLVSLKHSNLPDDEYGHLHEGGWNRCLDVFGDQFRTGYGR